MAQLDVGHSFAGYRVLAKLGAGGMGQVYLVEHPHLLRREALKVISLNVADNAEFQQRFTNEARTVATLNHPGIVAIHHYGVEGDSPWFTMAYLDGNDLVAGGLSDREVGVVALRAAEALDYAHRHGVIHRDVKPANIIVTREADGSIDQVVLLDFGIAKLMDSTSMTATQAFIGTLAYSATEVIDGQPAGPASDQYALACSIYELLTTVVPFEAPTPTAMMAALLSKPAPELSSRRPDLGALDPVFERALAKDPAQRFPDCVSFARALELVLAPSTGGPESAILPVAQQGVYGLAGGAVNANAPTVESGSGGGRRWLRGALLWPLAAIVVAAVAVAATLFAVNGSRDAIPDAAPAPQFTKVATNRYVACAIKSRDAYCWGSNENGLLGDGTSVDRPTPAKVVGIKDVTDISVGDSLACAVASGKAYCWGSYLLKATVPKEVSGLSNVTDISTNGSTTCAIADSSLYCWGSNSSGQVGDGTTNSRSAPVKVESISAPTQISVGGSTVCAVSLGSLLCWGSNEKGELGDGSNIKSRSTPESVEAIKFPSTVSVGDQFGDGTVCVARPDDSAYCWGANGYNQIGDGTTTDRRTPVKVGDDIGTISSNGGYTCAISTTESLTCWGQEGATYTKVPRPTEVRGLTGVTRVSPGPTSCAISDGQVFCWGRNSRGEVGDGTTIDRNTPVQIKFP